MRRALGWCLYVGVLAGLAWFLHQELPPPARCLIDDDFGPHQGRYVNADGSRLLNFSDKTNQFRIWDTHTGKSLGTFLPGVPWEWSASSRDLRFLVVQINDGPCRIIDAEKGREYAAECGNLHLSMLSFSPEERFLWIEEWHRKGARRQFVVEPASGRVLRTFDASNDPAGRVLGFTAQDHLIFWDQDAKRCTVRRLPDLDLVVERSFAEKTLHYLSPDHRSLLALDDAPGKTWLIWNLLDGSHRPLLDALGRPFVDGLSDPDYAAPFFSPKGDFLAFALANRESVGIWDTATGKLQCTAPFDWRLAGHGEFSPDARRVALGAHGKQVTLYDCGNGKTMWTYKLKWKETFEFGRPSGVWIRTPGMPYELDVETGQHVRVLGMPTGLDPKYTVGPYTVEQIQNAPNSIFARIRYLLARDWTERIRVTHQDTGEVLFDSTVQGLDSLNLTEQGTLLIVRRTMRGYRTSVWDLSQRSFSFVPMGIALAIGVAGIALRWAWRAWRRKRKAAASKTSNALHH